MRKLAFGLMLAAGAASALSAQEWRAYRGDLRHQHYSPLSEIDASNFNKLEVAWRFKTDSLGPRPEYKLEGTPLMVNGVLYTTAGTRRAVVALDAATGELRWVHKVAAGVGPRRQ
jgi:glucose dehydrogenase